VNTEAERAGRISAAASKAGCREQKSELSGKLTQRAEAEIAEKADAEGRSRNCQEQPELLELSELLGKLTQRENAGTVGNN